VLYEMPVSSYHYRLAETMVEVH